MIVNPLITCKFCHLAESVSLPLNRTLQENNQGVLGRDGGDHLPAFFTVFGQPHPFQVQPGSLDPGDPRLDDFCLIPYE